MLKMAHISAVALAGLVAFSAPAAAKAAHRADATETVQETERVDRTVQIRAGGQLRLKNFSGRVVITGSRRGDVAIHAVRHATRDRLEHRFAEPVHLVERGVDVRCDAESVELRVDDRRRDDPVLRPQPALQLRAVDAVDVEECDTSSLLPVQWRKHTYTRALRHESLGPPVAKVAKPRDFPLSTNSAMER